MAAGSLAGLVGAGDAARADPGAPAMAATAARANAAVPGEPAAPPGEGLALYMHHVHTVEGGWADGPAAAAKGIGAKRYEGIAKSVRRIGIDAVGVTEHNTFAHAPFIDARRDLDGPIFLNGIEYSGTRKHGHMGIIFDPRRPASAIVPAKASEVDADDLRAAIAAARAQGALTFVNHPLIGTFPWPAEDLLGADGVEVDSPATILASLDRNIAWWHARAVAERRPVVMVSGADYHYFPVLPATAFRTWLNRVRTDGEPTAAAIFDGLRKGHVQLVRPAALVGRPGRAPLVRLGADLDHDGRFDDACEGDVARLPQGSLARLQVRVEGGSGTHLVLFDEGSSRTPFFTGEVDGDDAVFAIDRRAEGFGFVRAEVRTCLGRRWVLTNPIYVVAGDAQ